MAKLYFRYSAMGAGKSLDLLKVAYNYEERGQNVLLFTSCIDNRYGEGKIKSRTGLEKKAISIDSSFNIETYILGLKEKPDCILFDESQFLTKSHIHQMTRIVDSLNIPIICYGLRSDFRGEPFEGSMYLMCLADTIEEMKTICHCGKKATMNMRLQNGKAIYKG